MTLTAPSDSLLAAINSDVGTLDVINRPAFPVAFSPQFYPGWAAFVAAICPYFPAANTAAGGAGSIDEFVMSNERRLPANSRMLPIP